MKVALLTCAILFATFSFCAADDHYVNESLGFEISSPAPGPVSGVYQSSMFYLPASDGFAANVNVQVQDFPGTIEQYKTLSENQFKQAGIQVINSTIEQGTLKIEYTGKMGGFDLHWFARAIKKADRVYLVTGTALQTHWGAQSPALLKSVNSFKLK